jgi:hypothetical protein
MTTLNVNFSMICYNGVNFTTTTTTKVFRNANWNVVYITVCKPLRFFFLSTKCFFFSRLFLLSRYLLTLVESTVSVCFKVPSTLFMVELFSSCLMGTLLFLSILLLAFVSLLDLFTSLYGLRRFTFQCFFLISFAT